MTEGTTKTCSICGETKHLAAFYSGAAKCKVCTIAHVKKYRKDNLEAVKLYDRERKKKSNLTDEEWQVRLKISRDYAKSNPELRSATCSRYVESNPKKRAAHILVGNSIRDGRLVPKPCEVCGSEKVHGHHTDYDKPLDVVWLCSEHHIAWHMEYGEGINAHYLEEK